MGDCGAERRYRIMHDSDHKITDWKVTNSEITRLNSGWNIC